MKKAITSILFPKKGIGFILFNMGFVLLIYVFLNHLEDTPIAYVSYLLSFYALVIFCIWFYQVCKFSNETIKKSKLYTLYQQKSLFVLKLSMICSFIFHLLYGLFKLGIGVYYKSWWFITFAIYYLLLCLMKLSLVKHFHNREKEYVKMKHTGVILLLLNIVLVGIILLIIKKDQTINYLSCRFI